MTCARIPIDMDAVRALHAQHWTCSAIAARLGVHYDTLRIRCKRAGIRFPMVRVRVDMGTVKALKELGLNLKAIAVKLGVAYNTLAERTAREGLRFRNGLAKQSKPRRVVKPPPQVPHKTMHHEKERTRAILDLYEAKERAATWWERDEIAQRIEALRA